MTAIVAMFALSSLPPTVLVAGGKQCGGPELGGREVALAVVNASMRSEVRAVAFSVVLSSGMMSPDGGFQISDGGREFKSETGPLRLDLGPTTKQEAALVKLGWRQFRVLAVTVAGKLVAVVGLDTQREGGQCVTIDVQP